MVAYCAGREGFGLAVLGAIMVTAFQAGLGSIFIAPGVSPRRHATRRPTPTHFPAEPARAAGPPYTVRRDRVTLQIQGNRRRPAGDRVIRLAVLVPHRDMNEGEGVGGERQLFIVVLSECDVRHI